MRRLLLALALMVAACSNQQASGPAPTIDAATDAAPTGAATTTTSEPVVAPPSTTIPQSPPSTTTGQNRDEVYVAWMGDGLAESFATVLGDIAGVSAFTIAHSDTLHIVESNAADGSLLDHPPDGFVIPVLGLGVDPVTYVAFVDEGSASLIGAMGPEDVILGAASAELRGIGVGGTIAFDDGSVRKVSAVVADDAVGAAEVVVLGDEIFATADAKAKYALISYTGTVHGLEASILARLPEDSQVHVRAISGDDLQPRSPVRPQVFIKQTFGEFAYRPVGGGEFLIDPAWKEANIVEVDIPLLGLTSCHRMFAGRLTDVMQGLIADGLEEVIDPAAFAGCWNPRYIRGYTRLSRHAWGAAADINFFNPNDGSGGSPVNPELVDRMADAGITSGHVWKTPDPGHFEYYGPEGG